MDKDKGGEGRIKDGTAGGGPQDSCGNPETIVFDFNDERVKRGKEPVAKRRFAPGLDICPK